MIVKIRKQVKQNAEDTAKGFKRKRKQQISTESVQTGWRNMLSSFTNFFRFWQVYEGKKNAKIILFTHTHRKTTVQLINHTIIELKPSIDLVLDHEKVSNWVDWLKRYYPRGNTTRNKCQHMSSFLRYLKTVEGYGNDPTVRQKISLCRSILNEAAEDGKILGKQQRAATANEEELMSKGTKSIRFFKKMYLKCFVFV